MGSKGSKEADKEEQDEKTDDKVHPFKDVEEDEAEDGAKESEDGEEDEERDEEKDKDDEKEEGKEDDKEAGDEEEEHDKDSDAKSSKGDIDRDSQPTPVMGRPRPALPLPRLAHDDPDRPPRELTHNPETVPDWGEEVYEWMRMIAPFTKSECEGLYKRFKNFDEDEVGWITGEDFSMQPEFDTNPLRDLIMSALELKDDSWLNLEMYVEKMQVFNLLGSAEPKMRFLYKVCDVNKDGVVDKGDFEVFLMLVCGPELTDELVVTIMEKTFAYVDTDENGVIDYDEFCKIVGRTDVNTKVSIVNF